MISDNLIDLERLQAFKENCDKNYAKTAGVFPNMMVGGLQVTYEELDDGTYNLVFTTNQD